ncbi:hypothetical protein D3C76_1759050 [compost metagenome]
MSQRKIAVAGGGLAGLYAAYRLYRAGIDFDLFVEVLHPLLAQRIDLGDVQVKERMRSWPCNDTSWMEATRN